MQTAEDGTQVEIPEALEFYYDMTKGKTTRVQARRYKSTIDENGNVVLGDPYPAAVAANVINSLLETMIDGLIIVIPDKSKTIEDYVDAGYNYFKTKGGGLLRATRGSDGTLNFQGGWQIEHQDRMIPVT